MSLQKKIILYLYVLLWIFDDRHSEKSAHIRSLLLFRIFPYLDWKRENTDQKKLHIWIFFAQYEVESEAKN